MALALDLHVPDEAWKPTGDYLGDPEARLSCSVSIAGCGMYVEAHEVASGSDEFRLRDSDADEALGLLISECGFPPQTFERNGRTYALLASPAAS